MVLINSKRLLNSFKFDLEKRIFEGFYCGVSWEVLFTVNLGNSGNYKYIVRFIDKSGSIIFVNHWFTTNSKEELIKLVETHIRYKVILD